MSHDFEGAEAPSQIIAPIQTFFTHVAQQCDFMARNFANRELRNPPAISAIGLEFILKAVVSLKNKMFALSQQSPTPIKEHADLWAAIKEFDAAYQSWIFRTLDVNLHLSELSQGWICPECHNAVPERAKIGGIRRGPMAVQLKCRCCGTFSPISEAGESDFRRLFHDLIADPRWNPLVNGFVWDGY